MILSWIFYRLAKARRWGNYTKFGQGEIDFCLGNVWLGPLLTVGPIFAGIYVRSSSLYCILHLYLALSGTTQPLFYRSSFTFPSLSPLFSTIWQPAPILESYHADLSSSFYPMSAIDSTYTPNRIAPVGSVQLARLCARLGPATVPAATTA